MPKKLTKFQIRTVSTNLSTFITQNICNGKEGTDAG